MRGFPLLIASAIKQKLDFNHAIEDDSFVLNHPKVRHEQRVDSFLLEK